MPSRTEQIKIHLMALAYEINHVIEGHRVHVYFHYLGIMRAVKGI